MLIKVHLFILFIDFKTLKPIQITITTSGGGGGGGVDDDDDDDDENDNDNYNGDNDNDNNDDVDDEFYEPSISFRIFTKGIRFIKKQLEEQLE